ncbi:LysR family transcriptional regulator [Streptomyces sp. TRM66268-LWL]|uniref:LysR family transcriptional regulator n=1 Tax=Streptomyces polyasparticus TaxID=2767826 RepID=A0ABR7SR09_9ACTN|nr:LysR family transcriptional regulator [Streptomyces polyasparticus]MBC9716951.1 LysR family transcriptional regulator [Streptomyces polyasparticus]
MDPHFLRTFVAVVDHGSFSVAASALGYTQSAVSQHIAALETDLGTPLLTRRPVAPTVAGARLMEHARPLLLRLDAARADLARLNQAPGQGISVACTPLARTALLRSGVPGRGLGLPGGLDLPVRGAELPGRGLGLPGRGSVLRVLGRDEALQAVTAGEVDLALVDGAAAPSDPLALADLGPLTTLRVTEEPLSVVLPAGHPLARRPSVRLADLSEAPWIDAPDTGIELPRLRTAAATDGFRARITYEGTDVLTLGALVAAGHGLTLLPQAVAARLDGVAVTGVSAPRIVHRVELVHGRLPEGPARELVERIGVVGAG